MRTGTEPTFRQQFDRGFHKVWRRETDYGAGEKESQCGIQCDSEHLDSLLE